MRRTPRIYPDPERPKPSPMEASSRFACGLVAGLVVGFVLAGILGARTVSVFATAMGAGALLCGLLAVPYGEDFWFWFRDFVRAVRWF
jgi:hypothetical protein